MSVEFDRGSPGRFDSRTLSRETLSRRTGRNDITADHRAEILDLYIISLSLSLCIYIYIYVYMHL